MYFGIGLIKYEISPMAKSSRVIKASLTVLCEGPAATLLQGLVLFGKIGFKNELVDGIKYSTSSKLD